MFYSFVVPLNSKNWYQSMLEVLPGGAAQFGGGALVLLAWRIFSLVAEAVGVWRTAIIPGA